MRKLTIEDFIKKAKIVHGNKYNYSKIKYVGSKIPVIIICSKHRDFKQKPNDHLNGRGCPKCGFEKNNQQKHSNKIDFINKAKNLHGNIYDYSLVNYVHSKTKVKIICSKHGVFEQIPNNHLMGQKCPKCFGKKRKTNQNFIDIVQNIHGNKYNYSLVDYINSKIKVKIICSKHGVFEQTPNSHLLGQGCPKCANKLVDNKEFIKKSKTVHGDKYDYSLVDYINSKIKVKIMCPEHGMFEQKPNIHLSGYGCSKCVESNGERIIRIFLENNDISYISQKKFLNCKNKKELPFNFYLPTKNLLIEYDGIQHFKPINHFGGINGYKKRKICDEMKNLYAKNNNIQLIRISYMDNIDNILTSIL